MPNFTGTSGTDVWTGGSGNEIATGAAGNDALSGNGGNDQITGDDGGDILNGGDGDDVLISGSAPIPALLGDYYYLSQVIPSIDTGTEVDTLNGGAGDDHIWAGYGDNVNGGTNGYAGDYLSITFLAAPGGITYDGSLATQTIGGGTIQGMEYISWIQGSNYDDTIKATDLVASGYNPLGKVYGMGGNDTLIAGYYTWEMDGGDGDDFVDGRNSGYINAVYGGAGNDTIHTHYNGFCAAYGGDGNDTIYAGGYVRAGAGDDIVYMQFSYYGGGVYGDEGNDILVGNELDDIMAGGSGADQLDGGAGNDRLQSGTGNPQNNYEIVYDTGTEHDIVNGGAGNDTIAIGYGDDADGGSGTDRLILSVAGAPAGVVMDLTELADGSATVGGGVISNFEVVEQIIATDFADQLTLGTFDELIIVTAGGGNDTITTGGSSAQVDGGEGDDRIISGIAADVIDGGAGRDVVDYQLYASGVTVDLQAGSGGGGDIVTHVESVLGTELADTIYGDGSDNSLTGNGGNDILTGRGGNDILVGGAGADVMIGGLGDDRFYIDTLGDVVTEAAGEGDDWAFVLGTYTLEQGVSVETLVALNQSSTEPLVLTGNDYGQSLYGNLGDNYLNGGQGADYLVGLGGNDSLLGGTGADHLEGGAGNDVYYVDDALDLVTEVSGEGDDLVVATASYALNPGASVETMSADPSGGNINLTGNELAQSLYGNGGNNILTGLGGADYLVGGAGNDKYYVDTADFIAEEAGGGDDWIFVADTYILREGAEIETLVAVNQDSLDAVNLTGNEFGQSLYGSQGANSLNGGGGNDYLVGLGGNDFLVGGAGNDNLAGGSGNDVYYVDSGDQIVENANEGDDLAVALQSFALGSGQSVETLSAADGAGAINLTGNALAQSLYGNAGNNVLTTGGGADYLVGGGGNDTFVLSNAPGVATIGDYAAGDVVDISQILNVAGGTDVTGGGYLKVTSGGQIQVDPNGGGDAFVTIGNINGSSAVTVRYVSGGSATDVSVARSAGMTAMAASPSVKPSADAQTGTDLPQHTQALAPIALDDSGAMHAYASFATHDAFALNHMHADWHVQPLAEWLV